METQRPGERDGLEYCASGPDGAVRAAEVASVRHIQDALLRWYRGHRRDLPWRNTRSAYRIFLAEMMLQQTQVERVAQRYREFLARFPTVRHLAAAPVAAVIRLWAGLGYNRRAVHLHRAAQAVVRDHGGRFPKDLAALLDLPGVGPYTARALLSFVDNAPVAVVDTNVRRVVGRILQRDLTAAYGDAGPNPRQFQALADSLAPAAHSARWNQALMDLGSSVCASRRPDCARCPVEEWCQATRADEVADLPALRPKGQGAFTGSRRFYRGRIIAVLRDLPPGEAAPFTTLVERVRQLTDAELPQAWLWELAQALARDGLIEIEGDRDEMAAVITLPQ